MNGLLLSFLAVVACLCFYRLKNTGKEYTKIIWIVYSLVFAASCYLFFDKVIYRFTHSEVWDFSCFYLYGKTAVAGYNFYLPESFHTVFSTLHFPYTDFMDFKESCVDIGFPYPPPTMLYFAPLGYLSFNTALTCWTIFNLLFVAGCIWLIYDLYFKQFKLNGLMLVITLIFILNPARTTIFYSQTNYIVLFLLLLTKKYSDTKYAGIFLALLIITKPYTAVFLLALIIMKNWKAVFYFIFSTLILVTITALLFGIKPFFTYIFNNPTLRLQEIVFNEITHQSLHAVLLRANIISFNHPVQYLYAAGSLLFVTGIYLWFLIKRKLYDFVWVTLLLVALMVYPGTLANYGVVVVFILFQFFNPKKELGFNMYLNILIIGFFYFINTYFFFGSACFLLLIIGLKSFGFFDRLKFMPDEKFNAPALNFVPK